MDIVDRLNGNAPSIMAMRDGAEEIMRLRRELYAAKHKLSEHFKSDCSDKTARLGCEVANRLGFALDWIRTLIDAHRHQYGQRLQQTLDGAESFIETTAGIPTSHDEFKAVAIGHPTEPHKPEPSVPEVVKNMLEAKPLPPDFQKVLDDGLRDGNLYDSAPPSEGGE